MRLLLTLLWLTVPALAGEWSRQEIEPKARPTNTAYTVGARHWQLGLVDQDYGLFSNAQVGTTAPLWVLGIPNGHAKVTAIQTRKLDFSLDGAVYWADVGRLLDLGKTEAAVTVTPIGWTGSWVVSRHFSVHGGTAWTLARANGQLTAGQIADGVAAVTGANIRKDLVGALGTDGGVYAGANLTLYQTRLSADWRFNRRDSLILTSNNWVYVSGLLAAGVAADSAGGGAATDLELGASARLKVPLDESIPTLTTLSWQFDWRRFNLRIGIPLPPSNVFAYFQAFDAYWILGPSRRRTAATSTPPAPEAPPSDTGTPPARDSGEDEAPPTDTGTE